MDGTGKKDTNSTYPLVNSGKFLINGWSRLKSIRFEFLASDLSASRSDG